MAEFTRGHPYLYLCNKDQDELARRLLPTGVSLPKSPYGLNSYQGYHYVAAIAAFLPDPWFVRFLGNQDVSADECLNAIHRELIYQAVMRASIRDLSATETCHVMVPDRETAEWLASTLDPTDPPRLGPIDGFAEYWRPDRKWESEAARGKARRERQAELRKQVAEEAIEGFLRYAYEAGTRPRWTWKRSVPEMATGFP